MFMYLQSMANDLTTPAAVRSYTITGWAGGGNLGMSIARGTSYAVEVLRSYMSDDRCTAATLRRGDSELSVQRLPAGEEIAGPDGTVYGWLGFGPGSLAGVAKPSYNSQGQLSGGWGYASPEYAAEREAEHKAAIAEAMLTAEGRRFLARHGLAA